MLEVASRRGRVPAGEAHAGGEAPVVAAAAAAAGGDGDAATTHVPAPWILPQFMDDDMNPSLERVLGGSRKEWPAHIDGRMYLSIWGGDRGGCCHMRSAVYPGPGSHGDDRPPHGADKLKSADDGSWKLPFSIHVLEVDPALYVSCRVLMLVDVYVCVG